MGDIRYPWAVRRLDHMAGLERMWTYKFPGKAYPYIAGWLDDKWKEESGRHGDYISYQDGHIVYKVDWERDGFPESYKGQTGLMNATGEMIGDVQRLVIDTLNSDLDSFRIQCAPCDSDSIELITNGGVRSIDYYPSSKGYNLKTRGLGWHYMDEHWQSILDELFIVEYIDENEVQYRYKFAME